MIMDSKRQIIRAGVSLARLCSDGLDDETRQDLEDFIAELFMTAFSQRADTTALTMLSRSIAHRLEGLEGVKGVDEKRLATAHLHILRLLASALPISKQVKARKSGSSPAEPKKRQHRFSSRGEKNQKKVLDIIAANPGLRTMEIISKSAGVLSDRTVKRALRELVADGLIRRVENNREVTYESMNSGS